MLKTFKVHIVKVTDNARMEHSFKVYAKSQKAVFENVKDMLGVWNIEDADISWWNKKDLVVWY